MAKRTERTEQTISVIHVAQPYGTGAVNPPNLWDFREFVRACEGLPDDTAVYLSKGDVGEGGQYNYKFSVNIKTEIL